jgi:hypothetical protein
MSSRVLALLLQVVVVVVVVVVVLMAWLLLVARVARALRPWRGLHEALVTRVHRP